MEKSHSLFSEVKVLGRKGECQEAVAASQGTGPHTPTGYSHGDKGNVTIPEQYGNMKY